MTVGFPRCAELGVDAAIGEDLRQGTRLDRERRRWLDLEGPPADVVPGAELVADPPVDAKRPETNCLVEPDTADVGQRDSCERVEEALSAQDLEE